MSKQIRKTYDIHGTTAEVWKAITTPEIIKKYFFGTNAKSDWKEGSPITFTGEWEGKEYTDKGVILKVIPEKLLTINYWSGMTGKPDIPENYSPYSYELEPDGDNTKVTLVQEGKDDTEESKAKAWEHWDIVMKGLDKLLKEEK